MRNKVAVVLLIVILTSWFNIVLAQNNDETMVLKLKNFVKDIDATSVNIALVKDGEITFMGASGMANVEKCIPATTKHKYMIGSTSKLFTATAVMQLVEQGKIRIEDDINKYLPFSVRHPRFPQTPITVEMLLTHTSSFAVRQDLQNLLYVNGDSEMSLKEVVHKYFDKKGEFYKDDNFRDYKPGTRWDYCNWNFVLLGYLVETLSGMPYHEYSYKNVLKPLEMHTAKWFLKEHKLEDLAVHYRIGKSGEHRPISYYGWPGYPDGQLRCNVEEISNFIIAFLNGGMFNGKRILYKDSVDRMLKPKEFEGLTGARFKGMGLSWFVQAGYPSVFSHGGSPAGTRINLTIDKESNSGFVAFITGVDEMQLETWNCMKEFFSLLQKEAASI